MGPPGFPGWPGGPGQPPGNNRAKEAATGEGRRPGPGRRGTAAGGLWEPREGRRGGGEARAPRERVRPGAARRPPGAALREPGSQGVRGGEATPAARLDFGSREQGGCSPPERRPEALKSWSARVRGAASRAVPLPPGQGHPGPRAPPRESSRLRPSFPPRPSEGRPGREASALGPGLVLSSSRLPVFATSCMWPCY